MPIRVHGFYYAAHNELSALSAAGGKQHVEIMFTVLSPFKLIENTVRKRSEALSAPVIKDCFRIPDRYYSLVGSVRKPL